MSLIKRTTTAITNRPYWYLYVAGVVLLLLSGYLWWTKVYLSPNRVFWGTVSNSLSTTGVTIETNQTAQQSQLKQVVQMELGDTNRAHSLTTLKQGKTEVKTEIIGTKDADYTRYRSIKTDQKNAQGKPLDVSKVENVWSKSDETQQTDTQAAGHQLFAQAVLGIGLPVGSIPVPIGKVTPAQRENLLKDIKGQNVYEFDAKKVSKTSKDGHKYYTYDLKIQTILYVRLMKEFAKDLGMHELDNVDPNTYQTAEPLKVKLTVDAVSRQITSVETGQGFKQTYSGYGLPLKVSIPKNPIAAEELQKRLTQLQ
jgi:hypothetical protein